MARVTAKDVLGMAVGKTPANMKYDKNKDGKITSADALAYSKTAAGKIAQKRADRAAAGPSKGQQQQAAMAAKAKERQAATAAKMAAMKERAAAKKAARTAPAKPAAPAPVASPAPKMGAPVQPPNRRRFMANGGMAKKGKK
jgi:hypothetical protein